MATCIVRSLSFTRLGLWFIITILLQFARISQAESQRKYALADWSLTLLGAPRKTYYDSASTCSNFFLAVNTTDNSSEELLFSLSKRNVLSAIDPRSGLIVWRLPLCTNSSLPYSSHPPENTRLIPSLKPGPVIDDKNTLLTSEGSSNISSVKLWTASHGKLIWHYRIFNGIIYHSGLLRSGLTKLKAGTFNTDVLVLAKSTQSSDMLIKRLDGVSGKLIWERELKLEFNEQPYMIASSLLDQRVYAISRTLSHNRLGETTIRIRLLDAKLGEVVESHRLISQAADTFHLAGVASKASALVWYNGGTDKGEDLLRVALLSTGKITNFNPVRVKGHKISQIRTISPLDLPWSNTRFLVTYFYEGGGHSGQIFHIDEKSRGITLIKEFAYVNATGSFSAYATQDGGVYFSRVLPNETQLFNGDEAEAVATQMTDWKGFHDKINQFNEEIIANRNEGKLTDETEQVIQSTLSVKRLMNDKSKKENYTIRCSIIYSTGDWRLIHNGKIIWSRPEYLAEAIKVIMVDDVKMQGDRIKEEMTKLIGTRMTMGQAYVWRVKRHMDNVIKWIKGLTSKDQERVTEFNPAMENTKEQKWTKAKGRKGWTKDRRGIYDKLAVILTYSGRLAAINFGQNGLVKWNVGLSMTIVPADDVELQLIQDGIVAVLWHRNKASQDGGKSYSEYFSLDTGRRVDNPGHGLERSFTTIEYQVEHNGSRLTGHLKGSDTIMWTFEPGDGEIIMRVVKREKEDVVASIGKVMPDGKVYYKYLRRNTLLVTSTGSDSDGMSSVKFTLINGENGRIIRQIQYRGIDLTYPISSVMWENWMAWSLTFNSTSAASQGRVGNFLVLTQLFVSEQANIRDNATIGVYDGENDEEAVMNTVSSGFFTKDRVIEFYSKFAKTQSRAERASQATQIVNRGGYLSIPDAELVEPYAIERSFMIPNQLTMLSVSKTKQGITSRALLTSINWGREILALPIAELMMIPDFTAMPVKGNQVNGSGVNDEMFKPSDKYIITNYRSSLGLVNVMSSSNHKRESLSFILAWGLDIFGAAIAVSGSFDEFVRTSRTFDKSSLVGLFPAMEEFPKSKIKATESPRGIFVIRFFDIPSYSVVSVILGLAALIMVLRPFVHNKYVNLRWGGDCSRGSVVR